MKIKLLLGIILFGFALATTAQITINRSDFGSLIGASIVQANDTSNLNTLSVGNAGANQTWNLTGISNDSQDTIMFKSPAGTPCAGEYPTATMALFDSGGYIFLHDDQTVIEVLGACMVFNPPDFMSMSFEPPRKQVTFPFTYTTSFSGQSKGVIQFASTTPPADSIRMVQTITYSSTIDGWGNVTTPIDTYPSLRQKYTQYQVDSSYIHIPATGWHPVAFPYIDTTIEYSWWSQHNPFIATIYTDGSGNILGAGYLISSNVGTEEIPDNSSSASFYPNPSNGKFALALNKSNINSIEVFNLMGAKVLSIPVFDRQISDQLDLTDFPKGIYFIKIYAGEKSHTEKVVVR